MDDHKAAHAAVVEEQLQAFLAEDPENTADEFDAPPEPAFMPKIEWTLSDGTKCSYWETKLEVKEVRSLEFGKFKEAVGQGDTPDTAAMWRAFAPGWTHSMDALLLRTALKDWDIEELGPVTTIHDCIRCLPSALPALRDRLRKR